MTSASLPVPHAALRLAPIQSRSSVLLWLMELGMRWYLGKVMTPARVIYARMPKLALPQMLMLSLLQRGLRLDALLVHLVQLRVSMHNGCTFCVDLHQAMALRERAGRERIAAALDADSPLWSAQERAVYGFVDDVSRTGQCSDESFARLRAQLDERQIVELTWLCAFTTYLNRLAVPLGIGSDGFCEIQNQRSAKRDKQQSAKRGA